MLEDISYYMIFGRPLIAYMGMLTLISLILTALTAILNKRGIRIIPFEWHPRLAALTVILAIMHGTLGILLYF